MSQPRPHKELFCGGIELDEKSRGVGGLTDSAIHLMFRRQSRKKKRKRAIIEDDFKVDFTPSLERLQSNREAVVRRLYRAS